MKAIAEVLVIETPAVVAFFDEVRDRSKALGPPGPGIRSLRRARGLTAKALGQLVGVPVGTVYNWELGKCRVSIDRVPHLASTLGLSADELTCFLQSDRSVRLTSGPPSSRLRRLRERAHLSQGTLAARIGYARHTIGQWERGTVRPPLHAIRVMAPVLGTTVSAVAHASNVTPPPLLDPRNWQPGDLPSVLRVLRHWNGLDQSGLADRCGRSVHAVRTWERGAYLPPRSVLRRLEETLCLPQRSLDRALPVRRCP